MKDKLKKKSSSTLFQINYMQMAPGRAIKRFERDSLERPFTVDEIKNAIFSSEIFFPGMKKQTRLN